MEWVETFYRRQDEWSGIYSGKMTDEHRRKVAAIAQFAGPGSKRVLELGAGGGQCAAAAAEMGHTVTAIELVPSAAAHARSLAGALPQYALEVLEGDFYSVMLDDQYDVICYWDGFGVGSDADQRRLLNRVASWLAPGGCALIDINTPWYWAAVAGRSWQVGGAMRRYGFDADGCRMLDRWWPIDDETQAVTQSLRCYAPADLRLLLEGTGLALRDIVPGGAIDFAQNRYQERVPLGQAMQYLAVLRLASSAES